MLESRGGWGKGGLVASLHHGLSLALSSESLVLWSGFGRIHRVTPTRNDRWRPVLRTARLTRTLASGAWTWQNDSLSLSLPPFCRRRGEAGQGRCDTQMTWVPLLHLRQHGTLARPGAHETTPLQFPVLTFCCSKCLQLMEGVIAKGCAPRPMRFLPAAKDEQAPSAQAPGSRAGDAPLLSPAVSRQVL